MLRVLICSFFFWLNTLPGQVLVLQTLPWGPSAGPSLTSVEWMLISKLLKQPVFLLQTPISSSLKMTFLAILG